MILTENSSRLFVGYLALALISPFSRTVGAPNPIRAGEMAGYLLVPNDQVDAKYDAGLTDQERENLQRRIEELHRNWKKDRDYLAPPAIGKLAEIDPVLIVTPPPGLEAGYVPIATRQAAQE